jgi:hypothetical protein
MESSVTPPTEPAVQKDSGLPWRGVVQVFTSPAKFFSELKDQPRILVPYLIYGAVFVVFFLLVADYIWEMQMNNPQMQERLGGQEIPPQAQMWGKISTIVFGTLAMLLVPLIEAAVVMFWGNFVFAGQANFKQLLSVLLYGDILFAIGQLVHVPLIVAKDSMTVTLSPAILVADQGVTSFAFQALSKLSLFHIWEIVVVGIGVAVVYDFARNKGYVISVLSLGLLSALSLLGTLIGGAFG